MSINVSKLQYEIKNKFEKYEYLKYIDNISKNKFMSDGNNMDDHTLNYIFVHGVIKWYINIICDNIYVDPHYDYISNFKRAYTKSFTFNDLKKYVRLSMCKNTIKFDSEYNLLLSNKKIKKLQNLVTTSSDFSDFVNNCHKSANHTIFQCNLLDKDDKVIHILELFNMDSDFYLLIDDLSLGTQFYNQKFNINNDIRNELKNTILIDLGKIFLRWKIVYKKQNEQNINQYHIYKFLEILKSIFYAYINNFVNRTILELLYGLNFVIKNPEFSNARKLIESIYRNKEFMLHKISDNKITSIKLPEDLIKEIDLFVYE